jgi:hypothetical protein
MPLFANPWLRWCCVWVPVAVLSACGGSINQTIKNRVFGLNSALSSVSYDLDMLERQLLTCNTAIQRNTERIGQVNQTTTDSAYQAAASSILATYRQSSATLLDLMEENKQLQKRYIELHTAYNDFVGDVETDDLGDEEAQQRYEDFNARYTDVLAKYRALVPRVQEAIDKHNQQIDAFQRNLRAYNLVTIERVR